MLHLKFTGLFGHIWINSNNDQCKVLCPIIDAEIPQDHAMLKDAIQMLDITQYKDGYFLVKKTKKRV